MAINRQKISQMTPKGSNLDPTDLLEVSVQTGVGYETFSITGQEIINAASGGSQDLQDVTDIGNTTTNDLIVTDGSGEGSIVGQSLVISQDTNNNSFASINSDGSLTLQEDSIASQLKNTNVTNTGVILEYPDKPTGSYTIATTSDLTSGYVPYTGATQDVDLGTNKISTKSVYITGTAGNGHIHMKHQSADATATGQSTAVWADTNGDIKWKNDGNYKTTLKTSSNTADRTYTFPNSDCTLTPDSRSISINGTTQDLSADRTYTVTDANLSTSDVTTNNVSTSKHGFAPKAPNDSKKYLDGTGAWTSLPIEIQVACSDETTALTTGTAKITFRTPCAMTVTAVRASLTTAQTSGNIFTVDINEGGTSILSTKLTIDNTERTSTTAATAPVISDTSLADDAEMTVDIDQIGDGTAKGLKVTIIGTRV